MVYRESASDPRQAELVATIAAHDELRKSLVRVQREHDTLEAETESQERKLARLDSEILRQERGGLISRLSANLRASRHTQENTVQQRDQLQATLARNKQTVADLLAEELRIAEKLAQIPAARVELAELKVSKIISLGAAEGPLGDELRMLDAAIEEHRKIQQLLTELLTSTERAARALGDIINGTKNLDNLPSGGWAVLEVGNHSSDVSAERLRQHLPYAQQVLKEALEALDASREELREDGHSPIPSQNALGRLRLLWAARQPLDSSLLLSQEQSALSDIDSILSALSTTLMRVSQRQQELEDKRDARISQF